MNGRGIFLLATVALCPTAKLPAQGPPTGWAIVGVDSIPLEVMGSCWDTSAGRLCGDTSDMFVPMDSLEVFEASALPGSTLMLVFERAPGRILVTQKRQGESADLVFETTGEVPLPRQPGRYVFQFVAAWPQGNAVSALRVLVRDEG
jgi:hypothetical protein